MNIVEGTARNMGVAIQGLNDKELAEQGAEAAKEEAEAAKREAELEAAEEASKNATIGEVEVINDKAKDTEEEK